MNTVTVPPKIILIAGAARSGKSTVARMIKDVLSVHVVEVQIPDPIKSFVQDLFDWDERHTDGDLKDTPDTRYPRTYNRHTANDSLLGARIDRRSLICRRCGSELDSKAPIDFDDITTSNDHAGIRTDWKGTCVTGLRPREAMESLAMWGYGCFPPIWSRRVVQEAKIRLDTGADVVIIPSGRMLTDAEAVQAAGGQVWFLLRSTHTTHYPTECELRQVRGMANIGLANTHTLEHLQYLVRLALVQSGFEVMRDPL